MKTVILFAGALLLLLLPCSAAQSASKTATKARETTSTSTKSKKHTPIKKEQLFPVLISTDTNCTVTVDDESSGIQLSAEKPISVRLPAGEHLIVATTADNKDTWRKVIKLEKPEQTVVAIALIPLKEAREQSEIANAELAKAKTQEAAQETADEAAKRDREKKAEEQKQELAERRQKINDLNSQIADLQNQIDQDEENARESDQAEQADEEACARGQTYFCFMENAPRSNAQRAREDEVKLRAQIRDLQAQIEDLQNQ